MNKKQKGTELIKKLIEREVRNQIKQVLNEYQLVPKKSIVQEAREEEDPFSLAESALEKSRSEETPQPPVRKSGPKFNTNNPMLNEVLNSTQGGIGNDMAAMSGVSEYRNLLNKEMFDSGDSGMIMNHGQMPAMPSVANTVGHSGKPVNPNSEAGQAIDKALTRDYTELVKRFKK